MQGKGIMGSDSRIRKNPATAQRGEQAIAQNSERQDSEGTVMTKAERREQFRTLWQQRALPDSPDIPGWHTCWVGTTHPSDTPEARIKLGYEFVRPEEVRGIDAQKGVQSGTDADPGKVYCNEMVLMKVPTELWQEAMAYFHDEAPREEEAAIRARMRDQTDEVNHEAGHQVIKTVGGGFDTLGANTGKRPVFNP